MHIEDFSDPVEFAREIATSLDTEPDEAALNRSARQRLEHLEEMDARAGIAQAQLSQLGAEALGGSYQVKKLTVDPIQRLHDHGSARRALRKRHSGNTTS